jgi:hypothetical protein
MEEATRFDGHLQTTVIGEDEMSAQDVPLNNPSGQNVRLGSNPTVKSIPPSNADDVKKRAAREKAALAKKKESEYIALRKGVVTRADTAAKSVAKKYAVCVGLEEQRTALYTKLCTVVSEMSDDMEVIRSFFRTKKPDERLLGKYNTAEEWCDGEFDGITYRHLSRLHNRPFYDKPQLPANVPPPAQEPASVSTTVEVEDVEDGVFVTDDQPATPAQSATPSKIPGQMAIRLGDKMSVDFADAARSEAEAVRLAVAESVALANRLFENLDDEEYVRACGNFVAKLHSEMVTFNGRYNKAKAATA